MEQHFLGFSVLEMMEWDVNTEDCIGLMAPLGYLPSEPKRPARPFLAMDWTDCGLGWMPGTDGSCGVRPHGYPGRTAGTAGVLGGAIP